MTGAVAALRILVRAAWIAALTLVVSFTGAAAQSLPGWDFGGLEMSRGDLEKLLGEYETVVGSTVYSGGLRDQASAAAAQIRERLEQGDFRVGDRIVLQIEGETQKSDTVVVQPGQQIVLTGMAPLSLDGVLRSELQAHLEREIGRFIRTPMIRSASLIRLSIRGAVAKPGFLLVPATALVDDVIMQAGGPAQNADLQRVQVERDNDVLVTSDVMRQALTEGRSVDQLNLRAGDQIVVGARAESSVWKTVGRYAVLIASTILLGVRAF